MEYNNREGHVVAISPKTKAVCIKYEDDIEGEWFNLGQSVKLEYINKGECEFNFQETEEGQNNILTFVKMKKSEKNYKASNGKSGFNTGNSFEMNDETKRMAALKYASNIYQGSSDEEKFKKLVGSIGFFIEEGYWPVEEEKV